MKNCLLIVVAVFFSLGSRAQSDFTGKSWSVGIGAPRLVQLPYTSQYIEHWSAPNGEKYYTEYFFRPGRHWQLHYGQQLPINSWLDFKLMAQYISYQFFSEEHRRYQEPTDGSTRIPPPFGLSTYRELPMSSFSALPGLMAHLPLGNSRFTWINGAYLGLMMHVGNLYPDDHNFYRSRPFDVSLLATGIFETGLEYRVSPKIDRTRLFASYQWSLMGGREGTGFWQNVPGFRQLQLGMRIRN